MGAIYSNTPTFLGQLHPAAINVCRLWSQPATLVTYHMLTIIQELKCLISTSTPWK